MIDKSNAVSAIGTLEFLDQIAKLNTIKTICNSQEINFDEKINSQLINTFNKNNIMKQLYEENYGGMKKKYTIKHRLYKQNRNSKKQII